MIIRLNIRQRTEDKEESLSPYAAKSRLSKGRRRPEEPCSIRTTFQRDRDRIIHSKAFRRLKHKTQVFIAPSGDHYVTRLTHTLEVSQLARTIARALNLNEDLTEAISMGHDLGHTPFGHIGEEALNELYTQGFRHNEQSLRVVDKLEKEGRGLNLTAEVRDGILHHSKTRDDLLSGKSGDAFTLEGQICKLADAVAYINHDIADAIRAGIIKEEDLPASTTAVLGDCHSRRIDTMVKNIITSSWVASGETVNRELPQITMSADIIIASNLLREFLFQRVYTDRNSQTKEYKGIIGHLYKYFNLNESKMPPEYLKVGDSAARRVVDYIAGMTDNYAITTYKKIKENAL
ncbi:MAG: deoxyguanosinetriphosphate triphosphohydrolase [Chloroflexi bacterium]|nr:deoxyguanosinetriphosphate triphosphohydrolase [Chloroflexota bacterium]